MIERALNLEKIFNLLLKKFGGLARMKHLGAVTEK